MKKSAVLFAGAGIVALALLFVLLKPHATMAPAITSEPVSARQTFKVVVKQGRRVSGPEVITTSEGADVTLTITSDQPDEMHLHGYDLHLDLAANEPATLNFKAVHSGRFDYELHHAHVALGTLEVLPR